MSVTYFAWAAASNPPITIGPANPRTGKRSQAGSLSAFASQKQRDDFIASTHGKAVAITAKEARQVKAGLDDRGFNELVKLQLGGEV